MFANPIWSLLLLAAPVALYFFVIRPRLKANFTATYTNVDGWFARQWARIVAFRTPVIASLGAVLVALPDLLVQIAPLDFSKFLPQPWGGWVAFGVAVIIPLMKAFETKPDGTQA